MIQGKQQANTELKQGGAHTWVEQLRNGVVCANIVFRRFGDLLSGAKVNKELKRGKRRKNISDLVDWFFF